MRSPLRPPPTFSEYARDGFYDGTLFHRVIPDFMIQGGGRTRALSQKKTRPTIRNGKHNWPEKSDLHGSNGADFGTALLASSQFFINLKDNDFLDHRAPNSQGWGYCVFGRVVEGTEVVSAIAGVATTSRRGHQDVPEVDVVIEKAEVVGE